MIFRLAPGTCERVITSAGVKKGLEDQPKDSALNFASEVHQPIRMMRPGE